MIKLRVTASTADATVLLERFAQLDVEAQLVEASRADGIAAANAAADQVLLPIVAEQNEIRAQLEPWWKRNGAELRGKRKSIELGGCVIGTKAGTASLKFALGDDKLAVSTLQAAGAWAKKLIRLTPGLDKAAIGEALKGKRGDDLRTLGFSVPEAVETFVLKPAKQDGTVTA